MAQKLHIDFNCRQRIAPFGPGETGFCDHSQTKVHDLTLLHTTAIKELISSHQGELCGRVYEDQLDENANRGNWRLNLKLLTTGLAGFLLLSGNRLAAQGRDTVKTEQHISPLANMNINCAPASASADSVSVSGDAEDVMPRNSDRYEQGVQFMRHWPKTLLHRLALSFFHDAEIPDG
jgi:hypothetical protein